MEQRSDKQQSTDPVKVIRHGAIAASIWQRRAATGYDYFDFSLSRSWKSQSTGEEGYSGNFFARNTDHLCDAARVASDWIAKHQLGLVTELIEEDVPESEDVPNVRKRVGIVR